MVDETGHSTGPHIHHGVNDFHIDGLEPNAVEENYDFGPVPREGDVKVNIDGEEVWINPGDLSTGTIGAVEENEQTVLEAILVTNMRIYDVLMAVYNKLDNPRATQLMKLHRQGHLLNEEDYEFE